MGVAELPRAGCAVWWQDLVAGGEDGHGGGAVDRDSTVAVGGQQGEGSGGQDSSRGEERIAGLQDLAAEADVVSRSGFGLEDDLVAPSVGGLDGDDPVGASRHGGAGHDAGDGGRGELVARGIAGGYGGRDPTAVT